ncbi:MAG: SDR family oxidoreductase [Salaquimonas sp.]
MRQHLFIFGFGFTSEAVAHRLSDGFESISGTTRSIEKFDKFIEQEVIPVLFDGDNVSEDLLTRLKSATHLLVSIGPNEEGEPTLNAIRNILAECENLQWIGYLSTVGVYGDHDGAWVNEETPCKPVSKRSRQRVAAENEWLEIGKTLNLPVAIFRLSGIYGPGRNTFMNIEKGQARRLVKPGQVFNRIHREDIASAVALAIEKSANGIFNITDDLPAPPQDVVTYAFEMMGKTPPKEIDFATADLTPMARSFYGENKRVSNAKSKEVLGMTYQWPDYQQSLKRMWQEGSWRKP